VVSNLQILPATAFLLVHAIVGTSKFDVSWFPDDMYTSLHFLKSVRLTNDVKGGGSRCGVCIQLDILSWVVSNPQVLPTQRMHRYNS
jgi:hypothetical protein